MNIFDLVGKKASDNDTRELENSISKLERAKSQDNALVAKLCIDQDDIVSKNDELKRQIKFHKNQLSTIKKYIVKLRKENDSQNADKNRFNAEMKDLSKKLCNQERLIRECEETKKTLLKRNEDLSKKIEKLGSNYKKGASLYQQLMSEISNLRHQENILSNEIEASGGISICSTNQEKKLKNEIKKLTKSVEQLSQKNQLELKSIQEIEASIKSLDTRRNLLINEAKVVSEENRESSTKLKKLGETYTSVMKDKIEADSVIRDLNTKRRTLQIELENLRLQEKELSLETSHCRLEIKRLESTNSSFVVDKDGLSAIILEYKNELKDSRKNLSELKKDIKAKDISIQELTKKKLSLEEDITKVEAEIGTLRTDEIEASSKFSGIKQSLEGSESIYKNHCIDRKNLEQRLSSLDTQVTTLQGHIDKTQDMSKSVFDGNAKRLERINTLESEHKELLLRHEELRASYEKEVQEDISLRTKRDDIKKQIVKEQSEFEALELKYSALVNGISKTNEEIDSLKLKEESLGATLKKKEEEYKLKSIEESELCEVNRKLMSQVGELEGKIVILERKVSDQSIELSQLVTNSNILRERRSDLRLELDSNKSKIKSLGESIQKAKSEIYKIEDRILTDIKYVEDTTVGIEKLEAEASSLKDDLAQRSEISESLTSNVRRVKRLADKKSKRIISLKSQLSSREDQLETSRDEYENLRNLKVSLEDEASTLLINIDRREKDIAKVSDEVANLEGLVTDTKTDIANHISLTQSLDDKIKVLIAREIEVNEELTDYQTRFHIKDEELKTIKKEFKSQSDIVNEREVSLSEIESEIENLAIEKAKTLQMIDAAKERISTLKVEETKASESKQQCSVETIDVERKYIAVKEQLDEQLNILANTTLELNIEKTKLQSSEIDYKKELTKLSVKKDESVKLEEEISSVKKQRDDLIRTKNNVAVKINEVSSQNIDNQMLVNELKKEVSGLINVCSKLDSEYTVEKAKSKELVDDIEVLRDQVRGLRTKKARLQSNIAEIQGISKPATSEVLSLRNTTELLLEETHEREEIQKTMESIKGKLEMALSKVEFDANLIINKKTMLDSTLKKSLSGIESYISTLPYVLSRIDNVKIELNDNSELNIESKGELRCDLALTKELLKDNVKGQFKGSVRFKISGSAIKLIIPTNTKKVVLGQRP